MRRHDVITYDDVLKLMTNVSKEAFEDNKPLYISLISENIKDLIKYDPNTFFLFLSKVEQYVHDRFSFYNELFPVDLDLKVEESVKFLDNIENNSVYNLELLRGKIIGLVAIKRPTILYQRIEPQQYDRMTIDQSLGLLMAVWIFLFHNINEKIRRKVSAFIIHSMNSDNKEISIVASDLALRFYFKNAMNLRKSIKQYFAKSLDTKFEICSIINRHLPFIKDERLVSFCYDGLFRDVILSDSSDLTIKFSSILDDMIKRLEMYKMLHYQTKYQVMIKQLISKCIDNNWWDVVHLDHLISILGQHDLSRNGITIRRMLRKKKDDPNLVYFPTLIIKAFKFNIILVDFLDLIRSKYNRIFLPTLSMIQKNISSNLHSIQISYSSLINQIIQKIMNKVASDDIENLKVRTFDDLLPKINLLPDFIKKLAKIDFDNKEREIKHYLKQQKRFRKEVEEILNVIEGLEPLIIEIGRSAPWIDNKSILSNIKNDTTYKKIEKFNRIIYELENPRALINSQKVKNNFQLFPRIKQFFSDNWLSATLNDDPYHPVIYWLNAHDKQDTDDDIWRNRWPLKNLLNLEHALSYFSKINDQGTSSIMDHLKKERNFFDNLVHIQLAKKIKQSRKFEIVIEEKINNKPVDILVKKNDLRIIIEVTSIEMYEPLKYSQGVVQIKDKVLERLKSKTKSTSKIKNIQFPIMLVIDTSRSPESDNIGLINSIRGRKKVSRVFVVGNQHIDGTDIDEDDITFSSIIESPNVSAVFCFKTIIEPNDTKFFGYVFINNNATYKIPMTELKALCDSIFANTDYMMVPR